MADIRGAGGGEGIDFIRGADGRVLLFKARQLEGSI